MEYIIRALELFTYFMLLLSLLSISNWYLLHMDHLNIKKISLPSWWLTRLNNEFVFPDPESPVINILYGWSGICGQFGLCSVIFFL